MSIDLDSVDPGKLQSYTLQIPVYVVEPYLAVVFLLDQLVKVAGTDWPVLQSLFSHEAIADIRQRVSEGNVVPPVFELETQKQIVKALQAQKSLLEESLKEKMEQNNAQYIRYKKLLDEFTRMVALLERIAEQAHSALRASLNVATLYEMVVSTPMTAYERQLELQKAAYESALQAAAKAEGARFDATEGRRLLLQRVSEISSNRPNPG